MQYIIYVYLNVFNAGINVRINSNIEILDKFAMIFFADIFKNNSLNIGVLPVQVSPEFLDKLFTEITGDPKTEIEVNLPEQTITILSTGEKESFDISSYKKGNLVNGFDDIDYLLDMKGEIKEFAENLPL